jgi:hypothetical protein
MSYRQTGAPVVPPEMAPYAEWLQKELEEISKNFNLQDLVQLATLGAPPAKPRNGMIVYANGSTWNPGGGEGYYGFRAGAWRKLD